MMRTMRDNLQFCDHVRNDSPKVSLLQTLCPSVNQMHAGIHTIKKMHAGADTMLYHGLCMLQCCKTTYIGLWPHQANEQGAC